ncbi:hypothetical protein EJB05_51793, partial [Eragrostis curvula]
MAIPSRAFFTLQVKTWAYPAGNSGYSSEDLRAEAQAHTVLEMTYTEQQLTAAVVSQGLRPALAFPESGARPNLLTLIQRCWDPHPEQRPSFEDIIEELNIIQKHLDAVACIPSTASVSNSQNGSIEVHHYQEALNWFNQGEHEEIDVVFFLSPATALLPLRQPIPFLRTPEQKFSPPPATFDLDDDRTLPDLLDVNACYAGLSRYSVNLWGETVQIHDDHSELTTLPNFLHSPPLLVELLPVIPAGSRSSSSALTGSAAAEFSVRAVPGFLKQFCQDTSPTDALQEAFIRTDKSFREELIIHQKSKRIIKKNWHPGCTAVTALIMRNKLFVANASDCRAILSRAGKPFPMTRDHVASCPKERERVVKAGTEVKWQIDTWRVGAAALQVTRSIGDDDLKPAVTAQPEIIETALSVDDEFLAGDGLWDVVSNEDVLSIIKDTVKEPGMCSKRLATEAAERGSKDNITVIVVFLRPVSTAERIY